MPMIASQNQARKPWFIIIGADDFSPTMIE